MYSVTLCTLARNYDMPQAMKCHMMYTSRLKIPQKKQMWLISFTGSVLKRSAHVTGSIYAASALCSILLYLCRGGSRNSLRGGGFWARILRGGGVRVQVRGNFHILTSKKTQKTSAGGGFNPPKHPPPLWIRYYYGQFASNRDRSGVDGFSSCGECTAIIEHFIHFRAGCIYPLPCASYANKERQTKYHRTEIHTQTQNNRGLRIFL